MKPKIEIIHVNISSTFLIKNRCKSCGKMPLDYYYTKMPYLYKDVNEKISCLKNYFKSIDRLTNDWYLGSDPRSFYDIQLFSFSIKSKGYIAKLHNSRGVKNKNQVLEFLICECGKTKWAFNGKSIKNRPEIINRKGRYDYPRKFEY